MKSIVLIIIGIVVVVAITGTFLVQQEPTPKSIPKPVRDLVSYPTPEPEPSYVSSRLKIEGKMAEQICSITNGECPSYYIGNIQDDGSVMVGITFSDTVKEKQFIFIIKNDTLSYNVRENEN